MSVEVKATMLRKIDLIDEQREALRHVLKSDSKAYKRERAAAILKVADGQIAAHVARSGLLRVRDPDTVYSWLDRFHEYGIAGLSIRSGRGRKRRFSPSGR
jgi:transposase